MPLDVLNTEIAVLVTAVFISAVLFLAELTRRRWWRTVHGRTLAWLAIGVLGITLRSSLIYWHVISLSAAPGLLEWACIQFFLILPVCFLVMTWQMTRPWLVPWLVRRRLARTARKAAGDRQDATPGRRSSR